MKAQFRYNKTIKTFVWLPSKTFASKYAAPVEGGNRERERERERMFVLRFRERLSLSAERNIIPFDVLRIERCRVARASMPRKQY